MLNQVFLDSVISKIALPTGYNLVGAEEKKHDNQPILWLRFQPAKTEPLLGSSHFSLTWSVPENKIMGLMHLSPEFSAPCVTIETDSAKDKACLFLKNMAPDLYQNIDIRWIKPQRQQAIDPPHDTGFPLAGHNDVIGMRVKMWDKVAEKYAWVIVANSGELISFERDVVWDSARHCRATEQWLHDAWLKNNNQQLPMPWPPVAEEVR